MMDDEDILAGGSDPAEAPQTNPQALNLADLLAMGNTGAQGKPLPAYAPDMARNADRISKILERGITRMEKDRGFDAIGAGLSADLASGGRMPYEIAKQQFEGREAGQAVNVANALSGLSKIGGQANIGNLLMRKTEQEARLGNAKAQRINEMVRGAAAGFDDPAMASAHIYSHLGRRQKENPNFDISDLPTMVSEAIIDARRNGLARKRTGKGGGPSSGGGGGGGLPASIPVGSDGTPDFTKGFAKPKTEFERLWNMSGAEQRKKLFDARISKMTGGEGSSGGKITVGADGTVTVDMGVGKTQDAKFDDEWRRAHLSAVDTINTMDQIRSDLDKHGGRIVGWVGGSASFLSGMKDQLESLFDKYPERYSSIANKLDDLGAWEGAIPDTVKRLIGAGPDAAVNRARFITLAYSLASAREPGGRLTEQDVARAMKTLGEAGGDTVAIRKLFDDAEKSMTRRMRESQKMSKTWSKHRAWEPRGWSPGEPAEGGPAKGYVAPTATNPLGIPGLD